MNMLINPKYISTRYIDGSDELIIEITAFWSMGKKSIHANCIEDLIIIHFNTDTLFILMC